MRQPYLNCCRFCIICWGLFLAPIAATALPAVWIECPTVAVEAAVCGKQHDMPGYGHRRAASRLAVLLSGLRLTVIDTPTPRSCAWVVLIFVIWFLNLTSC